MKKILLSLFVLVSLVAKSQTTDSLFQFKSIDSASGTKDQLYLKAKSFIVKTFNSAKDVIQMDDEDNGIVVCKGLLTPYINAGFGMQSEQYVNFTITLNVKDNKYRCVLSDFIHNGFGTLGNSAGGDMNSDKASGGIGKKQWDKIKAATAVDAQAFLSSLKVDMEKPLASDNF